MPRDIVEEGYALKRQVFNDTDLDDLFHQAIEIVLQYDRASASLIQRRLSIGYARAARLIDQLESAGVLSPADGAKPREVLIKDAKEIQTQKKEKNQYNEPNYGYKKPSVKLIKKPTESPWKKTLYDLLTLSSYKKLSDFSFPVGFEKSKLITADLQKFSHLLVVGNTISRKEGFLDTLLCSLLMKLSHNELRLVLIDPSGYLLHYDNLQHLLTPVIKMHEKSISALRWAMSEMDRRMKLFQQEGVRDIDSFDNLTFESEVVAQPKLPRILIVINHYADLSLFSPEEINDSTIRLTEFAHASGIHLILTNNRVTNQEIPQALQSNIVNKLFFRLTHKEDSGRSKIEGVEGLGSGEALYLSGFKNTPSKLEAVFTPESVVKVTVENIINSK